MSDDKAAADVMPSTTLATLRDMLRRGDGPCVVHGDTKPVLAHLLDEEIWRRATAGMSNGLAALQEAGRAERRKRMAELEGDLAALQQWLGSDLPPGMVRPSAADLGHALLPAVLCLLRGALDGVGEPPAPASDRPAQGEPAAPAAPAAGTGFLLTQAGAYAGLYETISGAMRAGDGKEGGWGSRPKVGGLRRVGKADGTVVAEVHLPWDEQVPADVRRDAELHAPPPGSRRLKVYVLAQGLRYLGAYNIQGVYGTVEAAKAARPGTWRDRGGWLQRDRVAGDMRVFEIRPYEVQG